MNFRFTDHIIVLKDWMTPNTMVYLTLLNKIVYKSKYSLLKNNMEYYLHTLRIYISEYNIIYIDEAKELKVKDILKKNGYY